MQPGTSRWPLAPRTLLAIALSSSTACDDSDTPSTAPSPAPASQSAPGDEPANTPPDDADPPPAGTDTNAPACDISPLFAEACPFTLERYQSIVGVDGELHLQPNPSKGKCALARGNDMLVMSEVREVSATTSANEAKGLQTMIDVRQAKAVDVGVPNCPAAYRGSLYDHLIVVGKSHIATFKVRYPKDETGTQLGSDERKQLNEQRSKVADKIAQGLGERLR